ncbi:hypothetical protein DWX75_11635 [Mitsuokella sp. AF21-1AC]|nr:hypothetical protein DWX75_11635 [Mitsuokella sp. AF21-1AC]
MRTPFVVVVQFLIMDVGQGKERGSGIEFFQAEFLFGRIACLYGLAGIYIAEHRVSGRPAAAARLIDQVIIFGEFLACSLG